MIPRATALLALVLSMPAVAQEATGGAVPAVNVQFYQLPIDSQRTLWTQDAGLAPEGYTTFRASMNYMHSPLGYWNNQTGEVTNLVENYAQLDLAGGVTFNRFRIGAHLPVNLIATSDAADSVTGLGDATIDIKGTLLDRSVDGVGFAVGLSTLLPTATKSGNPALGTPGVGGSLRLIVDKEFGPVLTAFNFGASALPKTELENVTVDDQLFYRAGAGYALTEDAGLSLDFAGHFNMSGISAASTPFEGMVGGYGRVADSIVVRGGIGRGFTTAIGSPLVRAVLMVGYEPPHVTDDDMDGIVNKLDACPLDPEDFDGFEDDNGCPDPDNDQDGVLDGTDQCPLEPEDLDDFRDGDGCIDPATEVTIRITDPEDIYAPVTAIISGELGNDEVGSMSRSEYHPGKYTITGEAPGFEPFEGEFVVPEDSTDPLEFKYVMTPKVKMGTVSVIVTDPEGNFIEASWQFTDQPIRAIEATGAQVSQVPGEYEVVVRAEGYGSVRLEPRVKPGSDTALLVVLQPTKVQITAEKIEIADKVYFDTGKATIKGESFELLDQVAIILRDHPELFRIRIEGHTDSRGSDSINKSLSDRRAKAVRQYLIDEGKIDAERLIAEGFGEERPLDPAENEEAWEKNRRVEFFVAARDEDQDGKADPAPDAPVEEPPSEAPAEEPAPEEGGEAPADEAPSEDTPDQE